MNKTIPVLWALVGVVVVVIVTSFVSCTWQRWHDTDRPVAVRQPSLLTRAEIIQGFRNGRVLVVPKPNATAAALPNGFRVHGHFAKPDDALAAPSVAQAVEIPSNLSVDDAIALLAADPRYLHVERDHIVRLHAVPNDSKFESQQWGLQNTGQIDGGVPGADIKAVPAWNSPPDASGVIVAIIDSGILETHEDLKNTLWLNSREVAGDGRDNDGNGYVDDIHGINAGVPASTAASGCPIDDSPAGHGTRVAGIIGAKAGNEKGIAGIAWGVRLMPLKAFLTPATSVQPDVGAGPVSSISDTMTCIRYAIANGAHIINASYGHDTYSDAELEVLKEARAKKIIVVVGPADTGKNNDKTPSYPASYPLDNIVAVASSNVNDRWTMSSDYAPGRVELAAPGYKIYSCGNSADNAYTTYGGTSFAAPHVTGALALLKGKYPTEGYRSLINRVLGSVDKLDDLSGRVATGGRLNLNAALNSSNTRPFNDRFDDASVIGFPDWESTDQVRCIYARGSNIDAESETGEPNHRDVPGGKSLWWTWRATRKGTCELSTDGTEYEALVAVYKGNSIANLTPVTPNLADASSLGKFSFTTTANTTYRIVVDGKGGATGSTLLTLTFTKGTPSSSDPTGLQPTTAGSGSPNSEQ